MGLMAEMKSKARDDLEEELYDRILSDWATALQQITEQAATETAERIAKVGAPLLTSLEGVSQKLMQIESRYQEILQAMSEISQRLDRELQGTMRRVTEQAATETAVHIAKAGQPLAESIERLAIDLVTLTREYREAAREMLAAAAQARETAETQMEEAARKAINLLQKVEKTVETSGKFAKASIEEATRLLKAAMRETKEELEEAAAGLRWVPMAWTGAAALTIGAVLPILLEIWRPGLIEWLFRVAMAAHGH